MMKINISYTYTQNSLKELHFNQLQQRNAGQCMSHNNLMIYMMIIVLTVTDIFLQFSTFNNLSTF